MSDYQEKDGDVSLFVNDKEGNENRPDLTGYAWIDGELEACLFVGEELR